LGFHEPISVGVAQALAQMAQNGVFKNLRKLWLILDVDDDIERAAKI
jgi:hypothetical protein